MNLVPVDQKQGTALGFIWMHKFKIWLYAAVVWKVFSMVFTVFSVDMRSRMINNNLAICINESGLTMNKYPLI